jgi:hypothetical protein
LLEKQQIILWHVRQAFGPLYKKTPCKKSKMKERNTFAAILEGENLFSKKEIDEFAKEAIVENASMTNIIVSKGLATRPMLTIVHFTIVEGH